MTGIGFVFLCVLVSILLILTIFLILVGLFMYAVASIVGAITTAVAGGIVTIVSLFILMSGFETFHQIAWVLFFKEIGMIRMEEEIVLEQVTSGDTLPTPEAA
jgi:hypothetical protein